MCKPTSIGFDIRSTLGIGIGPGRSGSGAWTPEQLPDLRAFWRADRGCVTGGGAQFVRSNLEYLSAADNPALSMGAGISFTIAGWVRFDSFPAAGGDAFLVSKWSAGSPTGYVVYLASRTGPTYRLRVSHTYCTSVSPAPSLAVGQWTFFCAWYSAADRSLRLSLNDANEATLTATDDCPDEGNEFRLSSPDTWGSGYGLDGRMASVGVWKRALSASERSWLHNEGAGRIYADLASPIKADLSAWWDLGEKSPGVGAVSRMDSHAANHLTDHNTVASTEGIAATACADGDPVAEWNSQPGAAADATQRSHGLRPTFRTGVFASGRPGVLFDGADDWLQADALAAQFAGTASLTFGCILKPTRDPLTGAETILSIGEGTLGTSYHYLFHNGVSGNFIQTRKDGTTAISLTGPAADPSPRVLIWTFENAVEWGVYRGEAAPGVTATPAASSLPSAAQLTLGMFRREGAVPNYYPLAGYLGAAFLCRGRLGLADRQRWVAWANAWMS